MEAIVAAISRRDVEEATARSYVEGAMAEWMRLGLLDRRADRPGQAPRALPGPGGGGAPRPHPLSRRHLPPRGSVPAYGRPARHPGVPRGRPLPRRRSGFHFFRGGSWLMSAAPDEAATALKGLILTDVLRTAGGARASRRDAPAGRAPAPAQRPAGGRKDHAGPGARRGRPRLRRRRRRASSRRRILYRPALRAGGQGGGRGASRLSRAGACRHSLPSPPRSPARPLSGAAVAGPLPSPSGWLDRPAEAEGRSRGPPRPPRSGGGPAGLARRGLRGAGRADDRGLRCHLRRRLRHPGLDADLLRPRSCGPPAPGGDRMRPRGERPRSTCWSPASAAGRSRIPTGTLWSPSPTTPCSPPRSMPHWRRPSVSTSSRRTSQASSPSSASATARGTSGCASSWPRRSPL